MLSQDSNDDDLFPMSKTRTKRDEFLIEIRKKKNQTVIQQKRAKCFRTVDDEMNSQDNGNMYFNDAKPQGELTEELKIKIREARETFFAIYQAQNWEALLPILSFLKDLIGEDGERIPSTAVIDMEIIPYLIGLLAEDYCMFPAIQADISWLFANISAGTTNDTVYLIEQGIIPVAMSCLKNIPNEEVHENVMWILANIAGEAEFEFRDKILETEILSFVSRQLCTTHKRVGYYKTCAWLISNLVRGTPFPEYDKISKCFMAINLLFDYKDIKIHTNCLLSLLSLSEEGREDKLKSIYEAKIPNKLAYLVKEAEQEVAHLAMKVAGNLLLTPNIHKDSKNFEKDMLEVIPDALDQTFLPLRKEACVTLANIYMENGPERPEILTSQILMKLLRIAERDGEELKAIATFSLFRVFDNFKDDRATVFIEEGVLEILMQNLASNHVQLLENTLLALFKVFSHGEKLSSKNQGYNIWVVKIVQNNWTYMIENLQNHPFNSISGKAATILDRFFPRDKFP